MAEWGRKEYSKPWPSRMRVWTLGAFLLTFVFFAVALTLEYDWSWTAAERLYLADYLKSGLLGGPSATAESRYTLLEAVTSKGQRLVMDNEIEPAIAADGRHGYRLTEEGAKDGITRLKWVTETLNDRGLHRASSEYTRSRGTRTGRRNRVAKTSSPSSPPSRTNSA